MCRNRRIYKEKLNPWKFTELARKLVLLKPFNVLLLQLLSGPVGRIEVVIISNCYDFSSKQFENRDLRFSYTHKSPMKWGKLFNSKIVVINIRSSSSLWMYHARCVIKFDFVYVHSKSSTSTILELWLLEDYKGFCILRLKSYFR